MLSLLQSSTAAAAQSLLAAFGTPLVVQGDFLHHAAGFAAQVDLECTAWWPLLILWLALLSFGLMCHTPGRRLAAAMSLAAVVITLVNQLRLVLVLWVGVNAPAHFAWVHELLGPLLLVAAGTAIVAVSVSSRAGRGAAAQGRPARA